MFELTYDERPYRVLGIDPGTNTLGVSVLDVDLKSNQVILRDARTFSGQNMLKDYREIAQVHGERMARLMAHEDNLVRYFALTEPDSVISESPFFNSRRPQAFSALVECMTTIRRAVWRYNPTLPLLTVDPPTAKKAVGAPARGGDKDEVKKALLKLNTLANPEGIPIQELDEHSVDATAVAYTRASYLVLQNTPPI